jgi:hypothetical protein
LQADRSPRFARDDGFWDSPNACLISFFDFSIWVLGCIPWGMQRLVATGAPKILPRIPAGMRPGMQAFLKTFFLKRSASPPDTAP